MIVLKLDDGPIESLPFPLLVLITGWPPPAANLPAPLQPRTLEQRKDVH